VILSRARGQESRHILISERENVRVVSFRNDWEQPPGRRPVEGTEKQLTDGLAELNLRIIGRLKHVSMVYANFCR
jgi:hypothetical protein